MARQPRHRDAANGHVDIRQHRVVVPCPGKDQGSMAIRWEGEIKMNEASRPVIDQLHRSSAQVALRMTDAAHTILAPLLGAPQLTARMLESTVVATRGEDRCLQDTEVVDSAGATRVLAMAMKAFERARQQAPRQLPDLVAMGALIDQMVPESGIATDVAFVASQTARRSVVCEYHLARRDGHDDADVEAWFGQVFLSHLAQTCEFPAELARLPLGEVVDRREIVADDAWQALQLGRVSHIVVSDTENCDSQSPVPTAWLPGAFNPLHEGHCRMAACGSQWLGTEVAFELSMTNVDKPTLDYFELERRLAQFTNQLVILTRCPTFVEKAQLAPGCTFLVGVDTIERIGHPRYYGDDSQRMDDAVNMLATCGCQFLVFGRSQAGRFQGLGDIELPPGLRDLCQQIPEDVFRADVSSTMLRRKA